jgi:putative radical SAM enzyme (TIGR03279 family)
MPFPQVVAVAVSSAADRAGIVVGDEIRSLNGVVPRDVIEYRLLGDDEQVLVELGRNGELLEVVIEKETGEPLGAEVSSPLFDRVRTCDNHCEFCFIYQLPKGMRKSLYVKDDDYRLSFLYGNFTTLTRFTEIDLERVVSEHLSPLYVSIHATDPEVRSRMLRNRRGGMSLRWLRQLLDHGIEVHGQIVVCPGLNDGDVLDGTLAGILESYPELASAAAVPLGVSRFSKEATMRPHTHDELICVLDTIERWQERFRAALGRPLIFAADEYYLLAGRPFPTPQAYDGFAQEENGVGMSTLFAAAFAGGDEPPRGTRGGFFQAIDGAPPAGYRARRNLTGAQPATAASLEHVTILTGVYGAAALRPLLDGAGFGAVELLAVENTYFGGNIAVTGLLTGTDLCRVLEDAPFGRRYLLPDVCLSEGRFLDGLSLADLPRPVEVVETNGAALRAALLTSATPRRQLLQVTGDRP